MREVLLGLGLAIDVTFSILAIRTALSWIRQPDRRHGHLALAFGSLALLILLAPLLGGSQIFTDIAIVLFLLSGYGLVMFRDSFLPLGRTVHRIITTAIVIAGLLGIVSRLPADPTAQHSPLQSLALTAILAVWTFCIVEPIARFAWAARGRPAVERGRLWALSLGYAGLLIVVMIGASGGVLQPGLSLFVDLLALVIVPLLYVAFFPPGLLRRFWRQPEEDELRHGLHDLLLYSPDRETLAKRALGWAERLVGGDAAFIIDADGTVLATRGIGTPQAEEIGRTRGFLKSVQKGQFPRSEDPYVIVPLDLQIGLGVMVIVAGRFTPLFGDEELGRLRQYSASITAGLDRVMMSSRIAALERAKSDFLNIASHELRGPMTVIKGYLTMLEAGALGDLSPKAQSVLPLLISKSDEVNWMVEQMIEASRLEEGRLELKKRRRDIVELTENAIDGVRMLLAGHSLVVESPKIPIDADVDPDRFQMVIRNLLSNASKYSPNGTGIEVDIHRNGESANITVTDQGTGISEEDQVGLFTRFVRIESTEHVKGTGLGLWLSREIARMHGGELSVTSEVGHGSTFKFTVPLPTNL
jgi:signal transduction histidine kinase